MKILNKYPYGSRVYGTNTELSDYDCILVCEEDIPGPIQYTEKNTDFTIYSQKMWDEMAKENTVVFMECFFLDKSLKQETFIPEFTINPEKIRRNFSKTASNSWVKCKKKLTIEKDFAPRIGKKSLWHSLRIIMFGIQILNFGRIVNYQEANTFYNEIVNNYSNNWEEYKTKYQPVYNSLKTKFRLAEHEKEN